MDAEVLIFIRHILITYITKSITSEFNTRSAKHWYLAGWLSGWRDQTSVIHNGPRK